MTKSSRLRDHNPTFTLRYTTQTGVVVKPQLLRREVSVLEGPKANTLGDDGAAWDIAVLNENGADVTCQFACFT
ncbi:hypothetical protein ACIGN6_32155 [Streptomyces sp. NPDC053792]|uniref:hypothetical protein n=1 Tax=Streptomyces sp. NPDC053792 TaxID=3365716 RepID=UPI0037CCCCF0